MNATPLRRAHPRFEHRYSDQLEMVRPSSTLKRVPPAPEGYRLRLLDDGEQQLYDDLFRLAFDDEGRFPEIVDRILPDGFFVVEHLSSRQLVASCLAFHGASSPRHPDAGQLGWLVFDPSHGNRGLGTLVSAAATNRLIQEGYSQPFLGTEDFRIAAISIYLRLGWQPFYYTEEMKGRWARILPTACGRQSGNSSTS